MQRLPNACVLSLPLKEILWFNTSPAQAEPPDPARTSVSWAGQNETNRYKKKTETKASLCLSMPGAQVVSGG